MKPFVENIIFKHQKKVLCIGLNLVSREKWKISAVYCKKQKNEVSVESIFEETDDLNQLAIRLPGNVPVMLQLDGWGILLKENNGRNSIPLNDKEFCVREYSGLSKNGSFYSIIRQDLLNLILDIFKEKSFHIVGLSFGPFNVMLLHSFFDNTRSVKAGKWILTLQDNHISSLGSGEPDQNTTYNFGGDVISSAMLPVYATAIAFFQSPESEETGCITIQRNEFLYSKLTNYLIVISLSLLLFLLLINYFIWDTLRTANTQLLSEVTRNEVLLSELKNKEQELKEKEILVAQYVGTEDQTHFSWYADQLAATLPPGIQLSLLEIQPVGKKVKAGAPIEYEGRSIEIEGDTSDPNDISEWVKAIRGKEWIKHVELVSFINEMDKGTGHFKLQINY